MKYEDVKALIEDADVMEAVIALMKLKQPYIKEHIHLQRAYLQAHRCLLRHYIAEKNSTGTTQSLELDKETAKIKVSFNPSTSPVPQLSGSEINEIVKRSRRVQTLKKAGNRLNPSRLIAVPRMKVNAAGLVVINKEGKLAPGKDITAHPGSSSPENKQATARTWTVPSYDYIPEPVIRLSKATQAAKDIMPDRPKATTKDHCLTPNCKIVATQSKSRL